MVTIVRVNDLPKEPTGDVYPGSTVAIAFTPTTKFRGTTAGSTGVFPDVPVAGNKTATHFHIHQIQFGKVVWRVCVTFLKDGKLVAWSFYAPDPSTANKFANLWRG